MNFDFFHIDPSSLEISGGGKDDAGSFLIQGNLVDGRVSFEKKYESYSVFYEGVLDGNSIRGKWNIPDYMTDIFRIERIRETPTRVIPPSIQRWFGTYTIFGSETDMIFDMFHISND